MSELITSRNSLLTSTTFRKPHQRLDSLSSLKAHPLFSHTLIATAGFYNKGGELFCYRCGLHVPYRELNASTFREHRKYSHICAPFQPADDIVSEVEAVVEKLHLKNEITLSPVEADHLSKNKEQNAGKDELDKTVVYSLLKRENAYLKEKTICCSCYSVEASYIILPCGHLGACRDCIKTLERCPICQVTVLDATKLKLEVESEDGETVVLTFGDADDKDVKGIQFNLA
ncbi:death-associated inhibitor of apoptosis 2 [Biomphalaria glabrata]|uniref:Death-associated inhibitor of apoptosis 2-like isoform X1 n=1 Tax=Biomphalaria glabrata TaxID=6526 RepID=A0A9U8E7I4_BIOGL|nr:death-associated inhibitor of apoptosis 2-like isoform X1 [Biomphalaria glabrata]XP_013076517.2 death-associated inhibitor of apoptosis 2-like isoform X1 [Biomphalaria glabrata]XP_055887970.1 death-associated inhibitor of apoptosis 2-like isoform X1 [Biomphalaria glabrata]KAI8758825.1 death-associated inhibitor of apoptosis 2-like [Biomphalaria glabrata]KAI8792312.1 death-associated inhibitor of apoptosis 2 [Biomphalaria glabrata]